MSNQERLTAHRSAHGDGAQPGRGADSRAAAEAKGAVAEYLRDLGLRDPDAIAAETQRIVAAAMCQANARSLREAAIRLTVKRLEHFLWLLSAQASGARDNERFSGVAARLPALLAEYPRAFSAGRLPSSIAAQRRAGVAPVVPPACPKQMQRQQLALVPAAWHRARECFRRWGGNLR